MDVQSGQIEPGNGVARRLRSGSKRVDQRRSVSVDAGAAVENQNLLDEYRRLKDLNDSITEFKKTRLNPVLALIKKRKKTLKEKKKVRKQEGLDCTAVLTRENELKEIEKQIKERFEKYKYEN